MYTILLADDEESILDVCRRYIELEGYRVMTATNGQDALKLVKEYSPHLIVLDIMMPIQDGWHVAEQVRMSRDTPIIMLTALGQERDRIYGLSIGADDYLVKPFSPKELVLRVNNILRRVYRTGGVKEEQPSLIRFGELKIDTDRRLVERNRKEIELTVKEYDLLVLLSRHPKQVFSKSQLIEKVWGYEYDGDANTVNVHIRRLREKIEMDPSNPQFIHTVWGIGYRFEGERDES
ncbi:transcriptional regulator [Bacillus coahuilensis p1.1.43]|uniref:Transcriptional regulator n=1 Tax=Bacillus coahuilensis p1.1.43 TaxID=1150625 RepID=A0A147K5W2_9BACI|nr:response regulator transcription factor [Bacillus coahuilensis]KUP05236.1 transcriptional regulator [Bacillus coahuilensis p1.1.43]